MGGGPIHVIVGSMVATERLGRVTGWVGASGQKSALGGQAILQAATRVKLEKASKVKSRMPTRLLTAEAARTGKKPKRTCSIRRGNERGMQERWSG
jgi:hypothetical protein